jgi:hypothetical protein
MEMFDMRGLDKEMPYERAPLFVKAGTTKIRLMPKIFKYQIQLVTQMVSQQKRKEKSR